MRNIKIIETGIDVSKILEQLKQYPEDWNSLKNNPKTESLLKRGFDDLPIDVLQLVMGVVSHTREFVGDSDLSVKTEAYTKHTEVVQFVYNKFKSYPQRCGFLCLPVGGVVGSHIDEGKYYLNKDRFHLSIQGTYEYTVGNDIAVIEPGTLFWFNNKHKHSAKNISIEPRITFVFDMLQDNTTPIYFKGE